MTDITTVEIVVQSDIVVVQLPTQNEISTVALAVPGLQGPQGIQGPQGEPGIIDDIDLGTFN